jgi:hypothetical protein
MLCNMLHISIDIIVVVPDDLKRLHRVLSLGLVDYSILLK